MKKIGFGGGCHWCTEAVFQSLIGVTTVEQGFLAPEGQPQSFSEGVIVHYDPQIIGLQQLVAIHLYTHKSTANHSMRNKYRSAVYTFDTVSTAQSKEIIKGLQADFDQPIITQVLPFKNFKPSAIQFQDYYKNNPEKPFCETYISPKLQLLMRQFSKWVNTAHIPA